MSNPWMKFYTSDWRADPALRMCSIGARGLWMEMICIMHEAEPYGSLLINGSSVTIKQLASLSGISERETAKLFSELMRAGVFSTDNGTVYSRRMQRDFAKAQRDKENGKGGGNPKLKEGVNPQDKAQIPEPIASTKKEENCNLRNGGKRGGPKHGAISPSRGTVFIREGTNDWAAYAEDYRKTFGREPVVNDDGGHWFKLVGTTPMPEPKRLTRQ